LLSCINSQQLQAASIEVAAEERWGQSNIAKGINIVGNFIYGVGFAAQCVGELRPKLSPAQIRDPTGTKNKYINQ
jgi:hypothetical protein